jgi:PAS domain S-box-containing protein
MEFNRKQLSSILEVLRESPRGMNVTEVAKESGMNRSTVAKYLEMLFVSGHVDMRSFGTSKVYYISQRMPISAFLNFTSDLIIVLDKYSRVLNANDAFFEFTNIERKDVVHKNINHFAFPLKFDPPIDPYISQAIHGDATTIESYYRKGNNGYYFNVKLIPLILDDGEKGVTVIFEDITEKKLAENALLNSKEELEKKVKERTLELADSERFLRNVFECIQEGISVLDKDLNIIRVNPTMEKWYGQNLSGSKCYRAYRGRSVPCEICPSIKAIKEKTTQKEIVYDIRGWSEVYAFPLIDENGEVTGVIEHVRDINERKRAEEALRDSESRFKALFDGASVAVFIIDLGTRAITDCNTYATQMTGRPKEELIGMHHMKLHPPESAEPCRRNSMIHTKDGHATNFETEILHKDGRRIPILINSIILEIGGKKVMMGSYLDITERKRVEEALHDSEEKFRALADSSNIGILLIQGEDIIYVNRALADIFGYTIDECLNMKYWDTALPDMKEYLRMRIILRQRGEPGPSRNELKMVRKNGDLIWLDCTTAVLQYRGNPAMMITVMDMTGRKMIEGKLRKSEELYRSLVENIHDIIWEVDENRVCTYISPRSREILGFEPEELVGKMPFALMVPEEMPRVQEIVKPFLDAQKPFELLGYWVWKKDGSKVLLETSGMPMFDEDGRYKGYRGVHRDITNWRR